jgi:cytochrome c oxidase subunit 3
LHNAHAAHQPGLAHHFETYEQQREASTLGVWLFIVQEIMFFGGLFMAYIVYRSADPAAFAAASHHLSIKLGAFNTAVLIGSSLTMAMAVRSAQLGQFKRIAQFIVLTMVLGGVFLGVKAVEYTAKFQDHLIPGPGFQWHDAATAAMTPHIHMFYNLYFAMTGLHALHMIVGMGILGSMIPKALKGRWTPQNYNFVEGVGLYWHFVDIIWIFLFPLLYLIGLHNH